MTDEGLKFVTLRNHPEFLEETANLLNSQWSRSVSARLHSLSEGNGSVPCSLVLLQSDEKGCSRVIGHSRLSQVLGNPKAVIVECVIIDKNRRGCGLGRRLMELTETYVSGLGCSAVFLSTTDKCQFYEHLGYRYCARVSPVRASASCLSSSQLTLLQEHFGENKEKEGKEQIGTNEILHHHKKVINNKDKQRTLEKKVATPEITTDFHREQPCHYNNCSVDDTITVCSLSVSSPSTFHSPPPPPPLPTQCNPVKSLWMMKEIT